ncbi:MAG: hypothetical protein A2430_00130 [Candidatus Liptonbacteria bacterium RIFOXYC1_FULL_36_8]|uniref:Putative 3-methyladenine DNA glycosylase n=2 Tax=Candidatus Liptoniibacteriota TaxID=1817909 RepID=A0A1G2CQC8_9BACT|nr:MAG: hypothetical protein A2430_00130 [Candidatus Liptonbacteria bacterium RIFOXYC1_FULL_36_8]OGZ03910.1 MAG: hypothetical protein A2604_03045 [Candidatus Liptonbacteria bacterium RIFOXYD1_FULL_36_11]
MLLKSSSFSGKDTVKIAKFLIGKILVRKIKTPAGKSKIIYALITETEAYDGFSDKASHASRGKTLRNTPMFASAGSWYIYFVYGNHFMLNLVTGPKNYPAAVLIRGIRIISKNSNSISGPGRLTKFLKINKNLNNQPANKNSGLWIEDYRVKITRKEIEKLPRVGVNYAGPIWSQKPWRFRLNSYY